MTLTIFKPRKHFAQHIEIHKNVTRIKVNTAGYIQVETDEIIPWLGEGQKVTHSFMCSTTEGFEIEVEA